MTSVGSTRLCGSPWRRDGCVSARAVDRFLSLRFAEKSGAEGKERRGEEKRREEKKDATGSKRGPKAMGAVGEAKGGYAGLLSRRRRSRKFWSCGERGSEGFSGWDI